MMNHRNFVGAAVLAAALLCTGAASWAAGLQDCFRDGYLCAVACDRAGGGKSAAARCEALCNAEEKVCLGKVAHAQPAYSPALAPMNVRWPSGSSPVAAR
jgi:hypothetical protein